MSSCCPTFVLAGANLLCLAALVLLAIPPLTRSHSLVLFVHSLGTHDGSSWQSTPAGALFACPRNTNNNTIVLSGCVPAAVACLLLTVSAIACCPLTSSQAVLLLASPPGWPTWMETKSNPSDGLTRVDQICYPHPTLIASVPVLD